MHRVTIQQTRQQTWCFDRQQTRLWQAYQHIMSKVKTANGIIALTKKCFSNITVEIFSAIYKSVSLSHFESWNQIWCPHLRKHINLIENVETRVTKLFNLLRELENESRLRILNFPTLAYRRKRGTILEMYTLTNQFYDSSSSERLFEPNARISTANQKKAMLKN